MDQDPIEYIPLSLIGTYVYCPRLFYYQFIEGDIRTGAPSTDAEPQAEASNAHAGVFGENKAHVHPRLYTASEALKVSGYLDVVEESGAGVIPIEHKTGRPGPDGPWLNDQIQLCAGAMSLEEDWSCSVAYGYIAYGDPPCRYRVDFTDELRWQTKQTIAAAWNLVRACSPLFSENSRPASHHGIIPEPLHGPKCSNCSAADVCLHDEVAFLRGRDAQPVRPQPGLGFENVLYVDEQGAYLGKTQGRIRVEKNGVTIREIPEHHIDAVVICGNIEMSTPLQRFLLRRGIPVHFLTQLGRYEGSLLPPVNRNSLLRLCQYRAFVDASRAVHLARRFVVAKLSNQRALVLRRARVAPNSRLHDAQQRILSALKSASRATTLAELLGCEGQASDAYFSVFHLQLKEGMGFDFTKRSRRPPTDPVNSLLSFAYSLLAADIMSAIHTVGLDPYIGFYHQPRYARPCLALDLMEEFRPIVADSVVITLVNNGIVKPDDFVTIKGAYYLNERGREAFYAAYERRKADAITHPTFGYRLPYRRAFELQARILAKYLTGELEEYYPLLVR
ncbi:MAG: CRISPR-associated endonuclease Cas1 [Armatimonadota bacterium]